MLALFPACKVPLFKTLMRALVFGLAQSILFFAYAMTMFCGGKLLVQGDIAFEIILK
jgi:hypothetical protein